MLLYVSFYSPFNRFEMDGFSFIATRMWLAMLSHIVWIIELMYSAAYASRLRTPNTHSVRNIWRLINHIRCVNTNIFFPLHPLLFLLPLLLLHHRHRLSSGFVNTFVENEKLSMCDESSEYKKLSYQSSVKWILNPKLCRTQNHVIPECHAKYLFELRPNTLSARITPVHSRFDGSGCNFTWLIINFSHFSVRL